MRAKPAHFTRTSKFHCVDQAVDWDSVKQFSCSQLIMNHKAIKTENRSLSTPKNKYRLNYFEELDGNGNRMTKQEY